MIILVKALLALLYNYFKLFNCIYSLNSINDFFFNSLSLIIVHTYIVSSLFCDVSSLIFNYLSIARRLVPYLNFALPFFVSFKILYNTVNKRLASRQRFLNLFIIF
jgi:hypothetical protein